MVMTPKKLDFFERGEPVRAQVRQYEKGSRWCYILIEGLEIPVVFHWNSIDSLKAFGESLVAQANALLQEGNK